MVCPSQFVTFYSAFILYIQVIGLLLLKYSYIQQKGVSLNHNPPTAVPPRPMVVQSSFYFNSFVEFRYKIALIDLTIEGARHKIRTRCCFHAYHADIIVSQIIFSNFTFHLLSFFSLFPHFLPVILLYSLLFLLLLTFLECKIQLFILDIFLFSKLFTG